jgi:hypothetical protein
MLSFLCAIPIVFVLCNIEVIAQNLVDPEPGKFVTSFKKQSVLQIGFGQNGHRRLTSANLFPISMFV